MFTLQVVINRAEHARPTKIIKYKYMLMCRHMFRINIMLCSLNSAVVDPRFQTRRDNRSTSEYAC